VANDRVYRVTGLPAMLAKEFAGFSCGLLFYFILVTQKMNLSDDT